MRSFFKRPSWANTGDGSSPSEFYRRADQTYGDIVAASREARVRSINYDVQAGEKASTSQQVTQDEHRLDVKSLILLEDKEAPTRECIESAWGASSYSELSADNTCRSSSATVPKPSDKSVAGALLSNVESSTQSQLSPHGSYAKDTPAYTPLTTFPDKPLAAPTRDNGRADDEAPLRIQEINPISPRQDLTAQILISSKIASTKSLVIKRKLHQSLKDVRLAWCEHQGLPRELYPFVALTWKGRRLFDVTTCKSLGTHSKDIRASAFREDGLDDCGSIYIHMEAVMDDRAPSHLLESLTTLPRHHPEGLTALGDKSVCRLMRLVFKCPGHPNYDVYTGPQTRVSQLIEDYRVAHSIGTEHLVCLTFDGDRLDPKSCPADYDMVPDDLVDVIIK